MTDYGKARRNMVENQLRPSRIEDPRVLEAMGEVAREPFVPAPLRGIAYADEDIRLPDGGFLIEPLAFARMLQAARLGPDDVALVVGCGTGYCAAVVARLAATALLLVKDGDDAGRLESLLDRIGPDNVVVVPVEDPRQGHASQAPFDVVLIVGEVAEVPPALLDQLGEGGRLVAVLEDRWVGKGTLFTRVEGTIARRTLFDAALPPLPELRRPATFVFE
jgi:protein-L-isoaspartate(D-aspartate) O-methyltransferase